MRISLFSLVLGCAASLGAAGPVAAGEPIQEVRGPRLKVPQPIDLTTVLRLAGANNLDVQIARERLAEAEANERIAVEQFFPYLAPGVGYRRHEGNVQAVEGRILDADKDAYTAGLAATAQVELGEAIFRKLAAEQLVKAAKHAVGAQREESVFQAVSAYFDLARARASSGVAMESIRISEDYARQVQQAVDAGLAFKGDLYRANTQVERNRLAATQARERQRLAASRLAQLLNLNPLNELTPTSGELAPIHLVSRERTLDSLVTEAISRRPELKQSAAQLAAARKTRQGAIYGPLVPTLSGQAFYGGLGGGIGNNGPQDFGQSSDYAVGLTWRIGPGGLFDTGRIRANDAHVRIRELELEKMREEISRQVVDEHTRAGSLASQITEAKRALEAAEQSLKLARERRQFAVGEVLENIQAEEDLTRARLDYVNAVAEHNKAQYGLERARGALVPQEPTTRKPKGAK
jgi:outer membrane protein TolC